MEYTYEEIISFDSNVTIVATGEDGSVLFIPTDPANSDYQAYLNKDKAEQSTPMVTDEAATL
jgi:hypothetical protein